MTLLAETKTPEQHDRIVHEDNTRGRIVEVSSCGRDVMVLVCWEDGVRDTYDASRLYFIRRTGTWLAHG